MLEKVEFKVENGILYGPYPDGVELGLDLVQQMVKKRLEFLEEKEYPAIVDTTGIKSVTKEARDYMASDEASQGIVAAALLSKSLFSTFVSNFFIKVSLIKAPIPVKSFTNEKEALEWLDQFK